MLMGEDGDLISYFNKIDETEAGIVDSSLKQILVNYQEVDANKGKIKCHLPLEHIFGFCKTF